MENATAGTQCMPRETGTRMKIISAARSLIVKHGFSVFSMEAVANLSGFSRRTVYNQFDNRESLYREVMREILEELEDAADVSLPLAMPLPDAVRKFSSVAFSMFSMSQYRDVSLAIKRDGDDAQWLQGVLRRRVLTPLRTNIEVYLLSLTVRGDLADFPADRLDRFCSRLMSTLEASTGERSGGSSPFSLDEIVAIVLCRLRDQQAPFEDSPVFTPRWAAAQ